MTDALLSQGSTTVLDDDRHVDPALKTLAYQAAVDGVVLLRNDGALPLEGRVSVFGRGQVDWMTVGYGSGGDVNAAYTTVLLDCLERADGVQVNGELAEVYRQWCAAHPVEHGTWGAWPRSYPEMDVSAELAAEEAASSETAVVVLGRAAGEDRDNTLDPGSYYLTTDERALLSTVTSAFARTVVVINTGNLMDFAWIEEYAPSAMLLAWLGGMEGGAAVADVLTGAAEPTGRLAATIAREYVDYPSAANFGSPAFNNYSEDIFVGYRYFETFAPDKVLYPFGFGLSYTSFDLTPVEPGRCAESRAVAVTVTNTGTRAGRQVVQAYQASPVGALSQPARQLVAFAKTGVLQPGESADVELAFDLLPSYDDSGATGHRSAYVLEPGEYRFFVGTDVRSAAPAGSVEVPELVVVRQLEEAAAPVVSFPRITNTSGELNWEAVPTATVDLRGRILSRLPVALEPTSFGLIWSDVVSGQVSLDAFIRDLPVEELVALCYGDRTMDSPLGAPGNAGALGGVDEGLRRRGVPPVITTDGPSGLRLSSYASLLPCGSALASTWDVDLVEALSARLGEEMLRKGSDVLLSPGMNIQRDPLCGRNFEYFSEDPLVSGRAAGAVVRGVQASGASACPKHFAANNQEFTRITNDSRVSERALREVYLRGFEIVVGEAAPKNIMTSYNKVNGVWAYYHYDLVTTILRGEWSYEGNIVTDWWTFMADAPLFPGLRDGGYRVRAQVDVLMPGGKTPFTDELDTGVVDGLADGVLTLGEVQRTARNVLRQVLANAPAQAREVVVPDQPRRGIRLGG
ncbi:MAG: glycoside hydrolase family 3 C-terminal domain-containing protein [Tessaracoccus sp.]|uniref:beta-glucosidase n=1 Tax=Tessaracoccus sp. TaxID=1971211 RepID=UPI001EC31D82|nr:glycoside hydrolase family 3 C-terminal domain-containing protein [Tessaracoccus sp.]MBK7822251.1 glycoside hydrolase family 3 C-terminal domain-containing protein [Tessaracoccus sp.]